MEISKSDLLICRNFIPIVDLSSFTYVYNYLVFIINHKYIYQSYTALLA